MHWKVFYGRHKAVYPTKKKTFRQYRTMKDIALVGEIKQFKQNIKSYSREDRISKLIRFSEFKIFNSKPYKKRRKTSFAPSGLCEICELRESTCQHHMILLANGGSNKSHNRINICDECHAIIHPWIIPLNNVEYNDTLTMEYLSIFNPA